jgi:hypothetical protein
MKKIISFMGLFFITLNIWASDTFEVPSFEVEMKASDIMNKIDDAIKNPEGVLNRYNPIGGTVKNKVVNHNEVSFVMTKKVVIISKTFKVHFTVDINEQKGCPLSQKGFLYTVNLDGSDSLVLDNIDRLEFTICIKQNSANSVTAIVSGSIYKGSGYSEPIGSIAKNTIQDQVDPFVAAIKAEVQNSLY